MGLFDYVTCKYPLPIEGASEIEFQSKDTPAQYMDRYEIREDGTLWHEAYDVEDRSDPNANGMDRLLGMMTRVNQRWEKAPECLTGEIRFYSGELMFSAYFVNGTLKFITPV